jgi:hypothetical protein
MGPRRRRSGNGAIEIIARIFGHTDLRTTMHYLGLDREDMSGAMKMLARINKASMFRISEHLRKARWKVNKVGFLTTRMTG